MDITNQAKRQIEQKINVILLALLLNKIIQTSKGLVTAMGLKGKLHFGSREKRAVQKGQCHLIMLLKWLQQM